MIRTFETHKIRKQKELTGCLWEFSPMQGEAAGKNYQVATPCCIENYPGFGNYRGEVCYKTQFEAKGRVRLVFKGVSHTATIYLDNKKIASHYNAYTIFDVVTEPLLPGNHILEVVADNRFSKESALHIPNDYMSYCGVSRPVVLEQITDVYIKWVHVTPKKEEDHWKVRVELCVENISQQIQTITANAAIAEKKVYWENVEIPAGEQICICDEISFTKVAEWSPASPVLYTVQAQLMNANTPIDDLIDRFGFRQISVDGKNILLNGQKIRIKGVCRHEDHPQFGCALPYAAMEADILQMKDLHVNSVRTAHYPNDELFLDLCDEQGILVWEENHARGLSEEDMKNPNFEIQAEQVIREMIPAHYNHPSIYIWGILNECASDSEYGKACYQKQFALIKEMDMSRPHSFASCKIGTDISLGLPDVVSYNIYPQWYVNIPVSEYLDDLYQWIQDKTEGAGKPFLITETGAGGEYGYRNAYDGKWTEDYQAKALREQLEAILDNPNCIGVYIWQFCDVRVSEEWFAGRPRTMNNKGIVDEFRRKKLAYEVVKEIYGMHE